MLSKNMYSDVNNLACDWGVDNKLDDEMVRKLNLHRRKRVQRVHSLCIDKILWNIRSCVNASLSDVLEEVTSDMSKNAV